MFFQKSIAIGKGRNISGVYIKDGGYILVYSKADNTIKERKYVLGKSAPENFEGTLISMGDMLAKNNAFTIESIKGRLRMKQ
ncbi:MAG TPA: hypothetical protein VIL26_04315 [Clostridia bacterium]